MIILLTLAIPEYHSTTLDYGPKVSVTFDFNVGILQTRKNGLQKVFTMCKGCQDLFGSWLPEY